MENLLRFLTPGWNFRICVDLTTGACYKASDVPPRLAVFAAGVSAILTAGCGSVVHSTQEDFPPTSATKMEGLAYWLPKGAVVIEGKWDKDSSDWA